jgi:hypothetical protein
MNPEILKFCIINRRFGIAVKKLVLEHHYMKFEEHLKNAFLNLVEIGKNPGETEKFKSDAYLDYFKEGNPSVNLFGNNPFYVLNISNYYNIDIVYLLIDECKIQGITSLIKDNVEITSQKICIFDIFGEYGEDNYCVVKPVHK